MLQKHVRQFAERTKGRNQAEANHSRPKTIKTMLLQKTQIAPEVKKEILDLTEMTDEEKELALALARKVK